MNTHFGWKKNSCLNIAQCCNSNGLCVWVNAFWHCVVCWSPPWAAFGPVYCRPGHTDGLLFLPLCQTWTTDGEAQQVVHCNGSGWLCVHVFHISPNHTLQNYNCIFFFSILYKTPRAVNQTFGSILIFKLCCFMTVGFVGFLSLCNTGTENGSSSQGAVGQSGPVAGSTGAVSKSSKGQGCAEKEEQAGNQKRARRQWESWSAEDKNSFFEGLYEVKGTKSSLPLSSQ